jgi:ATP-dependent Clp protease protease subunit
MNSNKQKRISISRKPVLDCDTGVCTEENEKKDRFSDSLLREQRTLVISEEISSAITKAILPRLLWLDKQNNNPIKLFINTPGGSADDGFAIHDIIRFVRSPVYTICNGLTASAGTIILLGAPLERRLTLPNSRIMLHQPAGGTRGQASDIEITAAEIVKLRERANKLIAQECKKTLEQVENDTNRDFWLSPEEACTYGLCSKIISSAMDMDAI